MLKITSTKNPKIKEAALLKERRFRKERNLFLIEGYRELKRAVEAHWEIATCFFCPSLFLGENELSLIEKSQAEKIECSQEVFEKLSYRDRPDGLLAIAHQKHRRLEDLKTSKTPFLLAAESIEKPGNLGSILRSSDAAGVDAVIVLDPKTDIFNPNVVRSSIGTLFTVPIIETSSEEFLSYLKKHNIQIVAATPHANCEFTEANFTSPLAILVGTEQYGLSEFWMKTAENLVKIPMFGASDSLNVAAATTLMLYEVVRQRKSALLR